MLEHIFKIGPFSDSECGISAKCENISFVLSTVIRSDSPAAMAFEMCLDSDVDIRTNFGLLHDSVMVAAIERGDLDIVNYLTKRGCRHSYASSVQH